MPIVGQGERALITNLADELANAMRKGLITAPSAYCRLLTYAMQRHRAGVEPEPIETTDRVWREVSNLPPFGLDETPD